MSESRRPTPLTLAIVGAGTMGSGIAQAALLAGHSVLLHDADAGAVTRAVERMDAALGRLQEKGRLSAEERDDALGRLRRAPDLKALTLDADLIIEAVVEDLVIKHSLFRALDMDAHPDVV